MANGGGNVGERIRVRIAAAKTQNDKKAWATKAEGGGYTLEWDDGFKDLPATRWHFEGDGTFNLEEVK